MYGINDVTTPPETAFEIINAYGVNRTDYEFYILIDCGH